MFSNRVFFVTALFLFVGCADAGEDALPLDDLTEGTGGIRGVLISEELFPVAGALVAIDDVALTDSDEAGRFEFVGLAPGKLVLNISATGYEPTTKEVEVPANDFAQVRISLVGIPGESPYMLSFIHNGFMACSMAAVYTAGWLVPVCPIGESADSFSTPVGADWRGGVHEMDWETADEMQLASTLDGPQCRASPPPPSQCAALVGGRAPLRIQARPEDAEYAARYAIDGKLTWPEGNYTSWLYSSYSGFARTEINATLNPACQEINAAFGVPRSLGCPFGVGVSTGIRFQYYHTTFYLQLPDDLDSFSARPDA